jgi:hypothetical protein
MLNSAEMYIDIGGKVEEFQRKLVRLLTEFGFQPSLRAEGFAFFPGEEQSWKGLPSIRLTRSGSVVAMRVHASDTLTALNASAVGSTPVDVYRLIMNGLVQAGKLFEEYGKKAAYVSVSPNLIERAPSDP